MYGALFRFLNRGIWASGFALLITKHNSFTKIKYKKKNTEPFFVKHQTIKIYLHPVRAIRLFAHILRQSRALPELAK